MPKAVPIRCQFAVLDADECDSALAPETSSPGASNVAPMVARSAGRTPVFREFSAIAATDDSDFRLATPAVCPDAMAAPIFVAA
jgi:hypothetical protein